jgi:ornithine carbamoyltransferase
MKKNSHGKLAAPEATVSSIAKDAINLTEGEIAQIRTVEESIRQAKMVLADLTVQRLAVEQRLFHQVQAAQQAQQALVDRARQVAIDHGIPTDDPSAGRWNLDTTKMVITRLG